VWSGWRAGAIPDRALVVDGSAARAWTDQLLAAAMDLDTEPTPAAPALDLPPPPAGFRWPLPLPDAAGWNALDSSTTLAGEAQEAYRRAQAAVLDVRREVAEYTDYL